jgi:hypothetical protein
LPLKITSVYTSAPFSTGRRTVYCLDAFNGFTKEDTTFGETPRESPKKSRRLPQQQLEVAGAHLAPKPLQTHLCVKAEVENYEFRRPIAFCLIDVALYRPTVTALHKVWNCLSPGGLAVVSNCKPGNCFDGAMQAYDEFTRQARHPAPHPPRQPGPTRKTTGTRPSIPVLTFGSNLSTHLAYLDHYLRAMHLFRLPKRLIPIA